MWIRSVISWATTTRVSKDDSRMIILLEWFSPVDYLFLVFGILDFPRKIKVNKVSHFLLFPSLYQQRCSFYFPAHLRFLQVESVFRAVDALTRVRTRTSTRKDLGLRGFEILVCRFCWIFTFGLVASRKYRSLRLIISVNLFVVTKMFFKAVWWVFCDVIRLRYICSVWLSACLLLTLM